MENGALPLEQRTQTVDNRTVSPDYFQVMGIPVLQGEVFTARDTGDPTTAEGLTALYQVQTLEEMIGATIGTRRFAMTLLLLFAGLALTLAAIGIYGVMSYAAALRTHEIGVRMAWGAQARDVLTLILRQGMRPLLLGVLIGLAGAVALTRLMKSLLFEVSATGPLTFVAIALLMAGIALLACWLPAHRATRVDPMVALRHD